MSQRPSACIPPPSDYTPQERPAKFREHGGRSNNTTGHKRSSGNEHRRHQDSRYHHHHNQLSQHLTFQEDNPKPVDKPKSQFRDKFYRNEDDDYFTRIQDDDDVGEVRQTHEGTHDEENPLNKPNEDDDDEDDPLDAYMKSLEGGADTEQDHTVQESSSTNEKIDCHKPSEPRSRSTINQEPEKKAIRLDIDAVDDIEESYYQFVEHKKGGQSIDSDEFDERQDLVEYDKDGNILSVGRRKKEIEPLPPIDHSTLKYESFQKSFYREHEDIQKLAPNQVDELRSKLEIKVSGDSPPKPVCSFAHFKFDEKLLKVIRRSEYTQPTPIQAQAIPAALLGRNVIGIAMTGSGKTAAYLWPMIVHIMGQPDLKRGDGPIGLVLVPTRELALQVYSEAKKFAKSYKITVICAYGGGSKYEQSKDLESGAEIVVATPGRLIDLIKLNATNLRRVTYLVLDEADRFFEMGFELQVRSICDQIRPDRQTLLFSATFKHKIEQLARTVTENPVKIIQKSLGEANIDVTQHVTILSDATKKWDWLISRLVEFTSAGSVLIFVTRIINCEELYKKLQEYGKEVLLLHGDMEQSERNRVITSFKRKETDILIATDVAARGLDIAHVKTVINYDVARDIDTHIHRVGRTGRAGSKGDAHTLLTDKDKEFAGHLVRNLESSSQVVEDDLMKLARYSSVFRKKSHGRDRKHEKHAGSSSIPTGSHHQHNHNRPQFYDRDRHGHYSHQSHQHNHHRRNSNESDRGHKREHHHHHDHRGHNHRGSDHNKDRELSSDQSSNDSFKRHKLL